MNNITDLIVKKFGTDKLLHFLVGGWFVCLFGKFEWYWSLIALLFIIVISFIKEKWLDKNFELNDIIAGGLGGLISFVYNITI